MIFWVAIVIVIVVGSLLLYWHFSGTQLLSMSGRRNGGFFDGVAGVGPADQSHDGGAGDGGDGGADGGGGH
jgi:hypothetical protein